MLILSRCHFFPYVAFFPEYTYMVHKHKTSNNNSSHIMYPRWLRMDLCTYCEQMWFDGGGKSKMCVCVCPTENSCEIVTIVLPFSLLIRFRTGHFPNRISQPTEKETWNETKRKRVILYNVLHYYTWCIVSFLCK